MTKVKTIKLFAKTLTLALTATICMAAPKAFAAEVGVSHPVNSTQITSQYDLSQIDRNLYGNMKVGNPYTVLGQEYVPAHNPDYDTTGKASWYGDRFQGKPTANGELFDKTAMTAAHKTLPLNSFVIVTNLDTGKQIKVRLNDRGPFLGGREIDLSEAAAAALGMGDNGMANVRVQYAGPANPEKSDVVSNETAEAASAERKGFEPLNRLAEKTEEAPATFGFMSKQDDTVVEQYSAELGSDSIALPEVNTLDKLHAMPGLPKSGSGYAQPGDETTLVIKGPVHMAKFDQTEQKAKFIAGRINK